MSNVLGGHTPRGEVEGVRQPACQNPKCLHSGDLAEAAVATDDGAIDLGAQRNVVS
jgi:hypothetical protein